MTSWSSQYLGEVAIRGGERTEPGVQYIVGQRQVEVADSACHPNVPSVRQLVFASRDQCDDAAVLVNAGLGVLVNVCQDRIIQQSSSTLRNGFELGHQVREFLHVPAADVAQDALALLAFSLLDFALTGLPQRMREGDVPAAVVLAAAKLGVSLILAAALAI